MSAKNRKTPARPKSAEIALDMFREKRPRGRIPNMQLSEVQTRGYHYCQMFARLWDRVGPRLSGARSVRDIELAFEGEGPHEQQEFGTLAPVILRVLREKRFPKKSNAQIRFLAESLAGRDRMSPRRARDICEQGRTEERNRHQIVRYSFDIECSCGYAGKSNNLACANCGAEIALAHDLGLSFFS